MVKESRKFLSRRKQSCGCQYIACYSGAPVKSDESQRLRDFVDANKTVPEPLEQFVMDLNILPDIF